MTRFLCIRVAIVCLALPLAAAAASTDTHDPPRRDEFGVIPEDGLDSDLSLPDPVLDRTWPMPTPGAPDLHPPKLAPDEEIIDPFADDEERSPAKPSALDGDEYEDAERPRRKPSPLIGRDGRLDAGSPLPAADPAEAGILEPELREPSEIEQEENMPSPLDLGDEEFGSESGDPEEW